MEVVRATPGTTTMVPALHVKVKFKFMLIYNLFSLLVHLRNLLWLGAILYLVFSK